MQNDERRRVPMFISAEQRITELEDALKHARAPWPMRGRASGAAALYNRMVRTQQGRHDGGPCKRRGSRSGRSGGC